MIESSTIAEYAAAIAMGVIGLAVGLQKVLKGWKETSAETSVVTMMHTELSRLSEHNSVLAKELSLLQVEIISLNKQLVALTAENQKLHSQVVSLTEEVNRLQELLETKS